jgi:hypothetical protein
LRPLTRVMFFESVAKKVWRFNLSNLVVGV